METHMDTSDDFDSAPVPTHPNESVYQVNRLTMRIPLNLTQRQLKMVQDKTIFRPEDPHLYYEKLCGCSDFYNLCACYNSGDKRFIAGSGVNGKIWKVRDRQTNETVVLKRFESKPDGKAEREICLHFLSGRNCDNVTKIRAIFMTDRVSSKREYFVMMELCEGGELFDYLITRMNKRAQSKTPTIFTERELASMIRQICKALEHLHTKLGIAHRDLKPENLLLTKNFEPLTSGLVKLSDFGFAKEASRNQLKTACYTPYYAPPEIFSEGNYNYACDIWSLGVILYILLTGRPPFYSASGQNALTPGMKSRIKAGVFNLDHDDFKAISPNATTLIQRMLRVKPEERITIGELMQDPWINQNIMKIPDTPIDLKTFDFEDRSKLIKETLQNYPEEIDPYNKSSRPMSSVAENHPPGNGYNLGGVERFKVKNKKPQHKTKRETDMKRKSGSTSSAGSATSSNITSSNSSEGQNETRSTYPKLPKLNT